MKAVLSPTLSKYINRYEGRIVRTASDLNGRVLRKVICAVIKQHACVENALNKRGMYWDRCTCRDVVTEFIHEIMNKSDDKFCRLLSRNKCGSFCQFER